MQFKLKMQFLVYDNDQVTTFGDTMMIEDSSIVMILKSGLHTMMIKDKKIRDIIIMPHPDPPPVLFAHEKAQIYEAQEY